MIPLESFQGNEHMEDDGNEHIDRKGDERLLTGI